MAGSILYFPGTPSSFLCSYIRPIESNTDLVDRDPNETSLCSCVAFENPVTGRMCCRRKRCAPQPDLLSQLHIFTRDETSQPLEFIEINYFTTPRFKVSSMADEVEAAASATRCDLCHDLCGERMRGPNASLKFSSRNGCAISLSFTMVSRRLRLNAVARVADWVQV